MRTKVTLVLVFLNVALFFFIFKFERSWRTEDALKEARRRVLGSETANIRSLTITNNAPGAVSYSLVRVRDSWLLSRPLDWPANQEAVGNIIRALQLLENETSFSVADLSNSGQSLADFGLETPRLTISFTSDDAGAAAAAQSTATGAATVLRVGESTTVGNYILSPDGTRIHVVGRALLDAISVPIEQLRADTLMSIPVFETRALSVQTGGPPVRIRRDGGWVFDTIVNARASKKDLEITINDLNKLRAASFPPTPPAVLPSASPTLRVTIDGNGRSETLFLGQPVAAPTANAQAAASEKPSASTEFYGQLMNGNTVRTPVFTVTVPNGMLERLKNAQDRLRERRVLDFEPALVTSVTLAAPNQGVVPITFQRLDSSSPDSPWHLVRPAESGSGSQTIAAESVAVRRLLDRLALLAADRFESDAPSSAQLETWGFNRPEREITITVSGAPGAPNKPMVLQLGSGGGGALFARTGSPTDLGPSVYAVTADLARDFPMDVASWRNRTVRDLPPAARISAIKITDLTTGKTVLETPFDASGQPTAEVADRTAVAALVAPLRTLHAKRFVLDRFADRVIAGGDERAWRYQIDVTIALPGGAGEQTSTSSLFLTERISGNQQIAGSREFDVVFEVDQPLLDALWKVTYGTRDPGPQLEKK